MATCNDLSGFIEALTELKTDAAKLDKFINGKATETVALGTLTSETLAGFSTRLDEYIGKLQAFADSSDPSVTIGEYAIPTLHQLVADVQADVDSFGSQLSTYAEKVGAFVNGNETATVNLGGVQVPTLRHMANDVANSVSANGAKLDAFVNGAATETVVLGEGAGATAEPTIRNMIRQINSLRQIILSSVLDVEGADLSARNATAEGGTAPRVFADRFGDVLSPKDFGAVGDGVTDDTTAWEAWDAVYGSMKFVPAGRYLVNGKVKSFAYGAYINLRETKEKDRLYVYMPCQNIASGSLDPGTMQFGYAKESIILKQGDTVVMVDTAGIEAVTRMRNFCASIGVDHVDYLIISHYHEDHCTGLSGFTGTVNSTSYDCTDTLDRYIDFSHCKVFLPVACHTIDDRWDDVARFSASEFDDAVLAKLQSLGITPIYPNEMDTLVVNNSLKITFLNAGLDELNEVFDIHKAKYGEETRLRINDTSMCCLVEHENATMLLTGDILDCGEARLAAKHQRWKSVSCTPGVVSPVPVEITGMGGSKFSYTGDYLDMNGDSIGALYSAVSLYRKAFSPDVYKINHHGVNDVSTTVSPEFYELLMPKMAAVVTGYSHYDRTLASGNTYKNPYLLRCPIYNAALDDVKFTSDGNEFTCTFGQVDWVDRMTKLVRPGDVIQPYAAVASDSESGKNFYSWLRIKFANQSLMGAGRRVSIIAHITSVADSVHISGVFEFKISCYNPDVSGREGDTYINCIYSNDSYFDYYKVLGMVYLGDNTYELVILQAGHAVFNISILSISGQESIMSIVPLARKRYLTEDLESLVLPQWFYRAETGFLGGATNSRINGTLRLRSEGNPKNMLLLTNPAIPPRGTEHSDSILTRIVFTNGDGSLLSGITQYVSPSNSTMLRLWSGNNYGDEVDSDEIDKAYFDIYPATVNGVHNLFRFNGAAELNTGNDTKLLLQDASFTVGSYSENKNMRAVFAAGASQWYISGVSTKIYSDRTEAQYWTADAHRSSDRIPLFTDNAFLSITNYHNGDKAWSTNGAHHAGMFRIRESASDTKLVISNPSVDVGSYSSAKAFRAVLASGSNDDYISGITTTFTENDTRMAIWVANAHRTDGVHAPAAQDNAAIYLFRLPDGTKYATGPTPDASANGIQLVTAAWVRTFVSSSSDRREKEDIAQIDGALLDAWDAVDFKAFRFRSEASCGDTDKLHFGVVAQDLVDALGSRGVNAEDYGIVLHEQFMAPGREEDSPEERYRVRYNELLTVEAAYVRRRLARIEERLATLEG